MTKFSQNTSPRSTAALDIFLNNELGRAFPRDPRTTLVNMAASCLVDEPLFYGDTSQRVRILIQWSAREFPEWTVKLAVFLREELHLRSISHLVLACAATVPAARPFLERAFPRVATRPDDMLEIAALLKDERQMLARSLPAVVRRSIRRKLDALSELHAIKYRKAGTFGLKHLIRICHPKPSSPRSSFLLRYAQDSRAWRTIDEASRAKVSMISALESLVRDRTRAPALLERCAAAGLPWEMVVPHFGSRKEVWTALAPQLPIMALLRNLRNLQECGALEDPGVRETVRGKLTHPQVVRSSKLMPFRWLSAYRSLRHLDREVAGWAAEALEHSVENLPRLPGTTIIACDNSGSMECPISSSSDVTPKDIGSLLGAVAQRICEKSHIFVFACTSAQVKLDAEQDILARAREISEKDVGGATNAYLVLHDLIRFQLPADRILFFTDMQIYGPHRGFPDEYPDEDFTSLLRTYRQRVSPAVRTYIFNLQPYEHFMTPADEQGVSYFSGWNENLLRYVAADSAEGGISMVEQIDRIAF
jgi:60 kDa SS-A/Ro ribonucleoprotein